MNEMWVKANFGNAEFGDLRLSKRLITIAKKMSERPEGSIPKQMGIWKDIKGCYNFLKNKKVTHKLIQTPHRKNVKEIASKKKIILFPQDTSEVDYSSLEMTEGLGYIGNHKNKGLMFHSCIAVEPHEFNPKIIGLANQQVWARKEASKVKALTRNQRNSQKRESDVWLKNIKMIGKPPEGSTWVSIGDRGNDIFEFFEGSKELDWDAVVRASHDRNIEVDGKETHLMKHMRSIKSMGTKTIVLKQTKDTNTNEVELDVSWAKVTIQPPERLEKKSVPIEISVVRCWNVEKEIEWILYSSIAVNNLSEALEKIEWYSNRWIIEEYHKCLKTGCRVESRQNESAKSLQSLLGVLGVIAILMLQLRNMARDNSNLRADELVDKTAVKIIAKRYDLGLDVSIEVFWRSVAKLGGFIGRKSDGQPGWQTLWGGWLRLLDMLWGHECLQPS